MEILDKVIDLAVKEAYIGIKNNHGGPFGAVIFKNKQIIAKAHNNVVKKHDPTCHGEMEVIRKACKKLKKFDLSGYTLYWSTLEGKDKVLSAETVVNDYETIIAYK